MTDQKDTKEQLEICDFVWARMQIVQSDFESSVIAIVPASAFYTDPPMWIGAEGPWVSRESPIDLRTQLTAVTKQRDELREELKQLDFEGGLGYARHERIRAVLTSTKGDV